MAGPVCKRLRVAVVLVLAGAVGRVLGAWEGGPEEWAVFPGFVATRVAAGAVVMAVVEADELGLAELPEEVASFACPSFAS